MDAARHSNQRVDLASAFQAMWRTPAHVFADARRYYVMDFFRGFAAIVILVWHYPGFAWVYPGGAADRALQPFYAILQLFYNYGLHAVAFFWMLSGFVLSHAYGGARFSTREFVVNRFARLYPLHLVTLLAAALISYLCVLNVGQPTTPNNDLYHFVLNLFFAPWWGFQKGFSFNAPIWSVSVEVAIYALFWFVLPALFKRGLLAPLVAAPWPRPGSPSVQKTYSAHNITSPSARCSFSSAWRYS